MPTQTTLDPKLCANALRFLAMDAVQKANSGHPGMPMGMADIAEVLWRDFICVNPANPHWFNRDRFILSNGHGAMLQYALLHLSGFDLSIEDLKRFRQLHSKTPGHPELHDTPGVETTTGPLAQGLANAVGMALAEKILAAEFNRPDFTIVDHFTYVFVGDGCLMEGLSHEVCSLAGTWNLGKLIVFYDDNGISIDGEVKDWFTDNTPERFKAYNWQVIENVDGHDRAQITQAIIAAQKNATQPTLICCKTQIGFGSPNKVNTEEAHGSPLGDAEIALTRKKLDWEYAAFEIPAEIYAAWDQRKIGQEQESAWNALFAQYELQYPTQAHDLLRRLHHELPADFAQKAAQYARDLQVSAKDNATRKDSQNWLNQFAPQLPELIGGSADLTGSNGTLWKGTRVLAKNNFNANYIHYGVREFGMSAIMNGLAVHGGLIPFGGTFLVFADYARNAIRLSAIMGQKVIYVLTHDSIGLGEDGPTHQPIEHITMLRATPNLNVWRPCDAVETAVMWQEALLTKGPSCLLLTRQNIQKQVRDAEQVSNIKKGGYVLFEGGEKIDAIILATGSEVEIAVAAAKKLQEQGTFVRVVSMPCMEVFKQQDAQYRGWVLPTDVKKRVAIEAGAADSWYQFVGLQGKVFGIERFGLSAPYQEIYQEFGLTVDKLVAWLK